MTSEHGVMHTASTPPTPSPPISPHTLLSFPICVFFGGDGAVRGMGGVGGYLDLYQTLVQKNRGK